MAKRAGAAPWLALGGMALLLGCDTPTVPENPPFEPVDRITRGEFYAEVSGAWPDTIDGFAEFGRVTQIPVPGFIREMIQIVAVRRDTARAARLVIENDDTSGFVTAELKLGAGLRAYVIRSGGVETLGASSGMLRITEATAEVVSGTFSFSLATVSPPGEGSIEGWFRAERHLSGQ
jgi:hypothetical protein